MCISTRAVLDPSSITVENSGVDRLHLIPKDLFPIFLRYLGQQDSLQLSCCSSKIRKGVVSYLFYLRTEKMRSYIHSVRSYMQEEDPSMASRLERVCDLVQADGSLNFQQKKDHVDSIRRQLLQAMRLGSVASIVKIAVYPAPLFWQSIPKVLQVVMQVRIAQETVDHEVRSEILNILGVRVQKYCLEYLSQEKEALAYEMLEALEEVDKKSYGKILHAFVQTFINQGEIIKAKRAAFLNPICYYADRSSLQIVEKCLEQERFEEALEIAMSIKGKTSREVALMFTLTSLIRQNKLWIAVPLFCSFPNAAPFSSSLIPLLPYFLSMGLAEELLFFISLIPAGTQRDEVLVAMASILCEDGKFSCASQCIEKLADPQIQQHWRVYLEKEQGIRGWLKRLFFKNKRAS